MAETKKIIPKRRFKEFQNAGEWGHQKFCEFAETYRGLTYSPLNICKEGIRVLRSSNIDEDTFLTYENDVFVEKNAVNIPYIKNGDILITSANGSSRLVGKHAIVKGIQEKSAVHGGFMLKTSSDFPDFLNASMSSAWYTKFIKVYVAGGNGAIGNLSKNDLDNQTILVPSKSEQVKIGILFKSIDNLITLQQRKLEKIKSMKKAYLYEMFPSEGESKPKRRFKGFSDNWELCKISEVINDIADGPFGSNLKTVHYTDERETRIIQLSNIGESGWQDENVRYTTFEHAKKIKRCIVQENELVMAKMMPAGLTIERPNIDKMYVLSSDAVRINLNDTLVDSKYFISMTKSNFFLGQINNDSQGSTRTRTSISKIREMQIPIPNLQEQKKLGNFFMELDNLITLHQSKLDKLKNLKKAYLNEMFI